jgi:hypothetical protein
MAAIWALPFAVQSIIENPHEYKSHFYHVVFFGIPAITAIILNLNSKIVERWTLNEIWSRVFIVCAGYGISSIATVLVVMDWGFYGGDAGGSYALFLLPSVALYAGIGICIGVLMTVIRRLNRKEV